MHFSTVGSAFLRNIIFARLLSPEDFGLAMTFGVVLLLVEYISNFGHESLLLRSRYGNNHGFQATMQTSLILRGLLLAAFIVVCAPYIAEFFKLPEDRFNYAWLALVPFVRGFTHLDWVRLQRNHDFLPNAKIVFLADSLSILVAIICAYTIDSYWAFYFSFVFRHCAGTFFSHLVATRSYRLRLHGKYLAELLSFGMPLILVGTIKYLAGETDKALIARVAGLEIFTSYLLTLMLISNGSSLVSNAFAKIFIRRISKEKDKQDQRQAYESNGIVALFLLLPMSLFMCVFAESIITFVFGMTYHPLQFLIPVICCLILLRSLNHWLNHIVVATSHTRILIVADLVRLSGLGIAILLTDFTSDVRLFCAAFCLGELLCFLFLSAYLGFTHKHFFKFALRVLLVSIFGMIIVAFLYQLLEVQPLLTKLMATGSVLIMFLFLSCKVSTVCMSVSLKLFEFIKVFLVQLRLQVSSRVY